MITSSWSDMGFKDATSGNDEGPSFGRVIGKEWVQVYPPAEMEDGEMSEWAIFDAPKDDPTDVTLVRICKNEAEAKGYIMGMLWVLDRVGHNMRCVDCGSTGFYATDEALDDSGWEQKAHPEGLAGDFGSVCPSCAVNQ